MFGNSSTQILLTSSNIFLRTCKMALFMIFTWSFICDMLLKLWGVEFQVSRGIFPIFTGELGFIVCDDLWILTELREWEWDLQCTRAVNWRKLSIWRGYSTLLFKIFSLLYLVLLKLFLKVGHYVKVIMIWSCHWLCSRRPPVYSLAFSWVLASMSMEIFFFITSKLHLKIICHNSHASSLTVNETLMFGSKKAYLLRVSISVFFLLPNFF